MSEWTFTSPDDNVTRTLEEIPLYSMKTGAVTVGMRELEMLLQARRSSSKSVVIPHTKERDRERLALRRLVERGLFSAPNGFGGPGVGWLYLYNLTERGRVVWLRCAR